MAGAGSAIGVGDVVRFDLVVDEGTATCLGVIPGEADPSGHEVVGVAASDQQLPKPLRADMRTQAPFSRSTTSGARVWRSCA